jgi:hypothetical protein
MNAFRGRLLASGASVLCSMPDPFQNWAGQNDNPTQHQQQQIAQNNGNGQDTNTNTDPNNNNNGGTNQDLIATIWDEKKDDASSGGKSGEQPNNQQQQPQNQPVQKTDEQLRAEVSTFLGSVGLGELTLSAADVEKLSSGENTHQEFANIINNRIQQGFLQAVQSSQRLMAAELDKRLPEMVEQAFNKSKGFFEGNNLRSILHKELPFTTDPSIGPVAETVMRQFLVKGATKEKAIEHTREYFDRVRKAMDPNYVPVNRNSRTTFRGDPRVAVSFVDVLKGK